MFPIGNLLPALYLDRIGRRWTMIWGCAGLTICMMMLAALLSVSSPERKAPASAAVAFFFLYMLIFGGTINVVPWVYGPEILPLEARTRGTAIVSENNNRRTIQLLIRFTVRLRSLALELLHRDDRKTHPSNPAQNRPTNKPLQSPVLINRIGWRTYLIFMILLVSPLPPNHSKPAPN